MSKLLCNNCRQPFHGQTACDPDALGPQLIRSGRVIEAGFLNWQLDHFPELKDPIQLARLKDCFFAGGLHATATMLMPNMDANAIADELLAWGKGGRP